MADLQWELTIRQGLNTLENLVKQGAIPAAEAALYAGVEPCPHSDRDLVILATKCRECGRIHQIRVDTASSLLAEMAQKVQQGLVDVETAKLMLAGRTEAGTELLDTIIPCLHERRVIQRCCGGVIKELCLDCGRRFDDPTTWILDHTNDAEVR